MVISIGALAYMYQSYRWYNWLTGFATSITEPGVPAAFQLPKRGIPQAFGEIEVEGCRRPPSRDLAAHGIILGHA